MLRQMNAKRQITLPPSVLEEAGMEEVSLFDVISERGKIVLFPKQLKDTASEEYDWEALKRFVTGEKRKGKVLHFKDPEKAIQYIKGLK